jgi:hypothetical protein
MKTKRATKKDFEFLRKHYGSHVAVAKKLHIADDYYRRVRNNPEQFKGSETLHEFIKTLAKQLKGIKDD